jgi:choline kinase
MIGIVLAAGAGRRLRPYTDSLPKALVPIADDLTILDLTLANFAAIGLDEVAIVVGYAGERIVELLPRYEAATGLDLTIVENERAEEWNNAYSLWTARKHLTEGAIVANGDTLHPVSVERQLLEAERADELLLATDDVKVLGDEEMKLEVDRRGRVRRINKGLPHDSYGEYIGVSLVPASLGDALADALERTWRADPGRYYEDAYQLLADEGTTVRAVPIGDVPWTEIDDHADLARAKELVCRY